MIYLRGPESFKVKINMENFKKYPRTFHLPGSPGKGSDDKTLRSLTGLEGQEIIVTLKMDGENTTLYHNGIHARSLDYSFHESRTWIQNKHSEIMHLIPEDIRLCGENLFALHSIHYQDLETYFYAFSVWRATICLSWDETVKIVNELGLHTVPVIYRGVFNQKMIEAAFKPYEKEHEGYVVRVTGEFTHEEFSSKVGKFVRANHIQSSEHWKNQALVKNKLKV